MWALSFDMTGFFYGIPVDYALICSAFPLIVGFIVKYLWTPWMIHKKLQNQGFKGRGPRFMIGDLLDIGNMVQREMLHDMPCIDHDFRGRVFPYFTDWSKTYGERFVMWFGYEPRIVLTDPESIKQLLSSKHLQVSGRSPLVQKMLSVAFGEGLIAVNGEKWTHQRRIVAPAFHSEKLKTLVDIIVMCTTEMLDGWEKIAWVSDKPCEIELTGHMDSLTADIFIRAEFGMDYSAGKQLFEDIRGLENLMLQACRYFWLPGSRFLPTSTNIEIWKRRRRLERSLKRMPDDRRGSRSYGTDLLGLMLSEIDRASTQEVNFGYSAQQVIDECKTFFLGGRETTSLLLSWGVLLLALHPDWQDRAREEARSLCGGTHPTWDSAGKFKIIGMILNETLRLYPPASGIIRLSDKRNIGTKKVYSFHLLGFRIVF